METSADTQKIEAAKNLTTVCYALYGASILVGVTSIVAIIKGFLALNDNKPI